jgi:hypothetical protein
MFLEIWGFDFEVIPTSPRKQCTLQKKHQGKFPEWPCGFHRSTPRSQKYGLNRRRLNLPWLESRLGHQIVVVVIEPISIIRQPPQQVNVLVIWGIGLFHNECSSIGTVVPDFEGFLVIWEIVASPLAGLIERLNCWTAGELRLHSRQE